MNTTTMNAMPAPKAKGGRWKELVVGVAYLFVIGTAFTGVVALGAALFAGH